MRIAFFTDSWKPNKDGVVYSIESLINQLPSYNVEVKYIVCPSHDGKSRESNEDGIKTIYARSLPLPFYKDYRVALMWKRLANKVVADVDIAHSHGVGLTSLAAALSANELNKGSVVTFHTNIMRATHYLGALQGLGNWFTRNYLSYLYNKYDVVVAPSLKAVSELSGIGVKAVEIPNGIDTSLFKCKRKPSKKPLLLHVGRVVKEKNLDMIIEYFNELLKEMPEAELYIVGDGPYYKELKKKEGGGVKLLGWVDRRGLKKIYAEADALVFASFFDTQGLVVFEAMTCGLPVIAHKDSAASEFVKDCGQVFRNKEEFIEAVKEVMDRGCKKDKESLDEKKTAERYAEIYKEVGGRSG